MKLLHLGDLHLGKSLGEFDLIDDQKYILDQIIGIIEKEQVDGVLIAGDVYDRAVPSEAATRLLDYFLGRLSASGTRTFVISGNHDSDERLNYGSRLFESNNIFISSKYNGKLYRQTLEDGDGKVDIYLLPFVKASQVKHYFPEAEISSYDDAVRVILEHADVDPDHRNVIVAHQFVTGRSEAPVLAGSEEISEEAKMMAGSEEPTMDDSESAGEQNISAETSVPAGSESGGMQSTKSGSGCTQNVNSEERATQDTNQGAAAHSGESESGESSIPAAMNSVVAAVSIKSEVSDPMEDDSENAEEQAAKSFDPILSGSESAGAQSVGLVEKIGYACFDKFDYVALGHIHSPQRVGRDEVRYSGSPLKYSLSEVDNEKSVPLITLGKKGQVDIRLIPLVPMRDMRHIKGKMENLLDKKNVTAPEDFIYVTLTDEDIINDAMGIFQQTYPNTVKIDYDNSHTHAVDQVDITGVEKNRTFPDLVKDFYRLMYNCEITDEEMDYMSKAAQEAGIINETDKIDEQ